MWWPNPRFWRRFLIGAQCLEDYLSGAPVGSFPVVFYSEVACLGLESADKVFADMPGFMRCVDTLTGLHHRP